MGFWVVSLNEQSLDSVALPAVGMVECEYELMRGQFIEARRGAQLRVLGKHFPNAALVVAGA